MMRSNAFCNRFAERLGFLSSTKVLTVLVALVSCDGSSSEQQERVAVAPEAVDSKRESDKSEQVQVPSVQHPEPPTATVDSTPAANGATVSRAEQLANAWIESLGKNDVEAMQAVTALPFTLHDPALSPSCREQRARTAPELVRALKCIADNKFLVEDLAFPLNQPHLGSTLGKADFPVWTKRYQKELGADVAAVGFGVLGAGIFHEMVLLVGPSGVHAFWRKARYDSH